VLELRGVTAGELLSCTFTGVQSVEAAKRKAIGTRPEEVVDYFAAARVAADLQGVRRVWTLAREAGHLTPESKGELTKISEELTAERIDAVTGEVLGESFVDAELVD
jgi:hypothetical protein